MKNRQKKIKSMICLVCAVHFINAGNKLFNHNALMWKDRKSETHCIEEIPFRKHLNIFSKNKHVDCHVSNNTCMQLRRRI